MQTNCYHHTRFVLSIPNLTGFITERSKILQIK